MITIFQEKNHRLFLGLCRLRLDILIHGCFYIIFKNHGLITWNVFDTIFQII